MPRCRSSSARGCSRAASRRRARRSTSRAARWLLNPGSVGQPRDGDPRAAYLLLDLDAQRASFRRVAYDIEQTQAEIRAAGLPELLAERLSLRSVERG